LCASCWASDDEGRFYIDQNLAKKIIDEAKIIYLDEVLLKNIVYDIIASEAITSRSPRFDGVSQWIIRLVDNPYPGGGSGNPPGPDELVPFLCILWEGLFVRDEFVQIQAQIYAVFLVIREKLPTMDSKINDLLSRFRGIEEMANWNGD
jgi:hypothetical protein